MRKCQKFLQRPDPPQLIDIFFFQEIRGPVRAKLSEFFTVRRAITLLHRLIHATRHAHVPKISSEKP
jgi:hypothetical protein